MLDSIISTITNNKIALGVAIAWLTHAYPGITARGGIWGIVKGFVVGIKPSFDSKLIVSSEGAVQLAALFSALRDSLSMKAPAVDIPDYNIVEDKSAQAPAAEQTLKVPPSVTMKA